MPRCEEQSSPLPEAPAKPRALVQPAGPAGSAERRQQAGIEAAWDADAAAAALLDSVPCGVLLFGLHGELRGVSAQFTEIMGREKSELLALGFFENLVEHLSSGAAQPAVMAERWRERRRAGEPCWDELEVVFPQRKHLERFARPILRSPW